MLLVKKKTATKLSTNDSNTYWLPTYRRILDGCTLHLVWNESQ